MADDWSDARRRTAYEESRAVIDAQNETMEDIDDKAMRTVRFIAIVIGLLVTAFQVNPDLFYIPLLNASLAAFVGGIIAGVVTYDESNLYVGPDGEFIEELAGDQEYDSGWDVEVLEAFAGMISENHDDVSRNGRYLRVTNGLLIVGIVTGVLAIAI